MIALSPSLLVYAGRIEGVLDRVLPAAHEPPGRLHEAMRYAVLGGGKRLRPMLAYAACEMFIDDSARADSAAAAVELIHAYSLVHDDLPAMDDDDLRRGRPTCHIQFDQATAILAGDALQALAFEVLANDTNLAEAPNVQLEMLRTLADACGSRGMVGGQAFDLAAVQRRLEPAELERMHVHKTGALIRASVRLGALAASSEHAPDAVHLAALDQYAHDVGLAFQIRDDILDVEGDTEVTGKARGADIARDKPTYPSILGMEASRALARELHESAVEALASAGLTSAALAEIARYAVERIR